MAGKTKTSTKASSKSAAATLLGSIGNKSAGRTKSTTPQITIRDEDTLESIAAIIDAKQAKAEAESALKIAEGTFRDDATKEFEDRCRADGTLHTSVRFMGNLKSEDGETRPLSLSLTQTRRCKKMQEAEASDPLHSAFGNDFDALFAPQRTVEIDTSVLSDDQVATLVEKLQEALGNSFDDAVTVEALIVPKEAFFGKRILDAKIGQKAANAAADGYAVPFASSFKL